METIRLPTRLVDVVAAAELNRKVRHGLATFDWSEVNAIEPAAAAALMRGISLDGLPDELGLDSMPEDIAQVLLAAIGAKGSHKPPSGGKASAKGSKTAAPSVWVAPSEPPPSARRPRPTNVLATKIPPAQALRARFEECVIRDLLGPAGGEDEEVVESNVRERYLVGMLAPRRLRIGLEQMDSVEAGTDAGGDDGRSEGTMPAAPTMFPSAIGLSFCVAPGTEVRVTASWGRYRRVASASLRREDGVPPRVWKRTPMRGTVGPLVLGPGAIGPLPVHEEQPEVVVRGVVNEAAGMLVVSLFLVNGQSEPTERRDEAWLFQPELSVEGKDGGAVFCARDSAVELGDALPQDEDRAMAMLYRDQVEIAVGHGVAVGVDVDPEDHRRATRVCTVVAPVHEVGAQRARMPPKAKDGPFEPEEDPRLEGLVLDMKQLAELPRDRLGPALTPLLGAYRAWIDEQGARIDEPGERLSGFEQPAREALDRCKIALARIERGIALLDDELPADAFRFANRAMWLQRVHGKLSEHRRRGEDATLVDVDTPDNRTWRTFQLAFVLLNLESLTDITHEDRIDPTTAVADLLWFPTGGGKTEAYLGVAAYVMAMRRLQGVVEGRSGEHGVAVLMRYTLRLLTLQQFQRATALMCACESIRRAALEQGDTRWGREPFRIGLWVGARSTPNRTDHADEALRRLRGTAGLPPRGGLGALGSPVQLKSCPWCGTTIEPGHHMRVRGYPGGSGRTLIFCGDARGTCLFSERQSPDEGLPVVVVDEEIYRLLPALLIATVDKFAQMPWRGEVQMLFGHVDGCCPRHGFRSPEVNDADSHTAAGQLPAVRSAPHGPLRPPDLIIQDELHLISGPLGTLTGLYETAVDELCSWEVRGKRVRPKVIASTATVRRAREQVHALFLRRVEVFPPHGLDAADSFFSIQRSPVDVPGRRYLGICAPGRRLKAALIRAYVALLCSAQQLYEDHGKHADPWMTLVGYFGSLRELAGMRRLVDDDVHTRAARMHRRGLASRYLGEPKELTSRLGSTEIPELLDRLEIPFDPALDARSKGAAPGAKRARRPIDVLLATNMISVGVDVQRLGLMACAGQPKTTAEYIQATSRVGRASPGLVCTVYNWARPRDLSHYETFAHYHATFYQHVEALSVTPFAPRALDRGLAALLVALVRLSGVRFNANGAAANIDASSPEVERAIEAISRRAESVEESKAIGESVRKVLVSRVQQWCAEAVPKAGKARLAYKATRDGVSRELLKPAGVGVWEPFTCLNSLRDVEPTLDLILDDGGLDDDPPTRTGGVA